MMFRNTISNIFSTLKNKKGASSIEIAIGVLIFIIVVCGFIDLTIILKKINTVSTTTTTVARILGQQGGIGSKAPEGHHGDYITSTELYANIYKSFELSGIKDKDWDIYINNVPFVGSKNGSVQKFGTYDYGKPINVKIKMKYGWTLINNFIPGQITQTKTSKRNVVSSFSIRNGGYKSEYKQN